MRALTAIVVLFCGVLLSTSLQRDTAGDHALPVGLSPLSPPDLSIALAQNRLSIRGTTVSDDHESALRRLAKDHFDQYSIEEEFVPAVLPGEDWEVISNRLLYTVAALDSGQARVWQGNISIRGVSADAAGYASRLEFLREVLPKSTVLESDVVVVRSAATFDELCVRAFGDIEIGPIEFTQSSTEIRQASFVTLDRITDFAHDCPQATIVIAGHTDASGDETWNQKLSEARAQAVADHIAGNGIDPERLIVKGLGAAEPIADNATAHGRALNRRIEFELR